VVEGGRHEWVQQAFILEYVTLAWMVVEAAVAIGAGLAARSITLLAFGIDNVIELASAAVLVRTCRAMGSRNTQMREPQSRHQRSGP
jgi:hypothetical protein